MKARLLCDYLFSLDVHVFVVEVAPAHTVENGKFQDYDGKADEYNEGYDAGKWTVEFISVDSRDAIPVAVEFLGIDHVGLTVKRKRETGRGLFAEPLDDDTFKCLAIREIVSCFRWL